MSEQNNSNKKYVSSTEISEILDYLKNEVLNKKRKPETVDNIETINTDNYKNQQNDNKRSKIQEDIKNNKVEECKPKTTELTKRAKGVKNATKDKPAKDTFLSKQKKGPVELGLNSKLGSNQKEVKVLNPRPVLPFAPASHQQRVKFLKLLSDQIKVIDPRFSLPNMNSIIMEYEIAKQSTKNNYVSNFKNFFLKVKKSNPVELLKLLNLNKDDRLKDESLVADISHLGKTSLMTIAKQLIHSNTVLSSNGYVIKIPEMKPDRKQMSDTKACERCKQKFKPNSQEGFKGRCQYHPGKKTFFKLSNNQNYFKTQCCDIILPNNNNEADPALVMGCMINNFHVYKDTNHEELQKKIGFTFSETSNNNRDLQKDLVGLDAEMVYTTKGFEVARVTVVDFYNTNEILYDKLIMPFGKVIDYNSEFSGIHHLSKDNTVSFYQMRQELNNIIDSDTIIIGHGLENDFNVLRLMHTNVIDTAILYPTKNGRGKYPLKTLADTYLHHKIQTGEHSSAEDSIAAIQLVKYKIKKMSSEKK